MSVLLREEALKRLEEKCGHFINMSTVIYRGTQEEVTYTCLVCGKSDSSYYQNMTRKKNPTGCTHCARKKQAKNRLLDADLKEQEIKALYKESPINFSLFHYTGIKSEGHIFCNDCGEAWDTTYGALVKVLDKTVCPYCAGKKKTVNSVIRFLSKTYGDLAFFGEFIYETQTNKSWVYCYKCKKWRLRSYSQLQCGHLCNTCGCERSISKGTLSENEAINRINRAQCYTLDLDSFVYTTATVNSTITCLICNTTFKGSYANLTNSYKPKKCKTCSDAHVAKLNKPSTTKVMEDLEEFRGGDFTFGYFIYKNNNTKIPCTCKNCGRFKEIAYTGLLGKKHTRCVCQSKSKAEITIALYLDVINQVYIEEHRIEECRSKKPLPFDFYLHKINLLAEYQGEQHFIPWRNGKNRISNLKALQKRDKIKKAYACKHHNFLEIHYKDQKDLHAILDKALAICEANIKGEFKLSEYSTLYFNNPLDTASTL